MHVMTEQSTPVAIVAEINPINSNNKYHGDYENLANEDTVLFYDWLADSGVTLHICNHCNSFEIYHPLTNSIV
jgi:hypothetical protein